MRLNIKTPISLALLLVLSFMFGHLYGDRLLKPSVFKIHGEINPHISELFREWIASKSPGQPATVRIESYGGHLSSGFKIAYYLRTTKADITCFVDSHAMSAGALILQNCQKIFMTPNSTILYHLPRHPDPKSDIGYTLYKPESTLYKMFVREVKRVGILTDNEMKAILKGEDVIITGSDVMNRLYNHRKEGVSK